MNLNSCDTILLKLNLVKPGVRLLIVLLFIISVNLRQQLGMQSLAIYLGLLISALLYCNLKFRDVTRRLFQLLPFLIMLGLFFPWTDQGLKDMGLILAKTIISGIALIIFGLSANFQETVIGLQQMGTPRLLITILTTMHLFLKTLLEESKRMNISRDLRFFKRNYHNLFHVNGRIIGSLFLRTYERGERITAAMLCRGWNGAPQLWKDQILRLSDGLIVILVSSIFLIILLKVK